MGQEATDNTALEEELQEETPQSSWDSLDQEFEAEEPLDLGEEEPQQTEEEPEETSDDEAVAKTPPEEETVEEAEEPAKEEPESESPEKPAAQAPEEQKVVEEEEAPPPPQPQLTAEQRQALRSQAVEELAKGYVLTEDEAQAFETDPVKALPRLAAELHTRVFETVVGAVMQRLPEVIHGTLATQQVTKQREDAFFSRWESLAPHRKEVLQIAQMWRQMNPTASTEEAIEGVGKIAMAALGLTQPGPEPSSPPPVASPTPPRNPPVQRTAPTRQPTNPYSRLADEWDAEYDEPLD